MSKYNILLLEDDEGYLESTTEILQQEGYNVFPARNYEKGQLQLRENEIHLVIADKSLKKKNPDDEDGLRFIINEAPHITSILLTAYPNVDIVRKTLKPRLNKKPAAVDFVTKDEGIEALLRAIREAILLYVKEKEEKEREIDRDGDREEKRYRWIWIPRITLGISIIIGLIFLLKSEGSTGVLIIIVGAAIQIALEAIFRKTLE